MLEGYVIIVYNIRTYPRFLKVVEMVLYIQIHRQFKCSCECYIRNVNECNIYTTIDVVVKRRIVIVGIILVSKTTILPTMPSQVYGRGIAD